MSLFPSDADDDGSVATEDRPKPETVRALEGFNYRKEAVRLWSRERAETTLAACRREERIALARAADTAKKQDGDAPRGQPGTVERLAAAAYLEEAMKDGPDATIQACLYCGHVLTDAEARQMAMALIRQLRGTPGD